MCVFFFSSRRRHTRWPRDWSSDVCSSDLIGLPVEQDMVQIGHGGAAPRLAIPAHAPALIRHRLDKDRQRGQPRSEERRVGNEWRSRGPPRPQKKNKRAKITKPIQVNDTTG